MKQLFFLIFFSLTTFSYGQIGMIAIDVSREFVTNTAIERGCELEKEEIDNITYACKFNYSITSYYFDEYDICYFQLISLPSSKLNTFINALNTKFVKVEELKWKDYEFKRVYIIEQKSDNIFYIIVKKDE